MIALLLGLLTSFTLLGPGVISYAGEGTLERVAARRERNGWGLTETWRSHEILIAPADCRLLGKGGWLVTGDEIHRVVVVDCEQKAHRGQMAERGLLADVNEEELVHKRGWLVLR